VVADQIGYEVEVGLVGFGFADLVGLVVLVEAFVVVVDQVAVEIGLVAVIVAVVELRIVEHLVVLGRLVDQN